MSDSTALSCEEALRLLAEYLDGELHGPLNATVEQHLEHCRGCFSRAEFERQLRGKMASLARVNISGAFEERIRSIIDRFPSS
jgi:anti-sigma factor (TIGR02949 family)